MLGSCLRIPLRRGDQIWLAGHRHGNKRCSIHQAAQEAVTRQQTCFLTPKRVLLFLEEDYDNSWTCHDIPNMRTMWSFWPKPNDQQKMFGFWVALTIDFSVSMWDIQFRQWSDLPAGADRTAVSHLDGVVVQDTGVLEGHVLGHGAWILTDDKARNMGDKQPTKINHNSSTWIVGWLLFVFSP